MLSGALAISISPGLMSSTDREAALWEMEEHHLQERHQLVKQQLKDQYFLQRHELVRKHEKVRSRLGRGMGLPPEALGGPSGAPLGYHLCSQEEAGVGHGKALGGSVRCSSSDERARNGGSPAGKQMAAPSLT